jgi:allantoin racemase
MRLLIINPNTSDSVTRRIADAAARASFPGDEFKAVSAPFGVPLIVDDDDAKVAVDAVIAAARAHGSGMDGIIIASFGDTGLEAVRETTSCPVVGIARAAFSAALAVGTRFSIVSFSPDVVPSLRRIVEHYGLSDHLASIRVVEDGRWDDPGAIQVELHDRLLSVCRDAMADGGDAIVLGGGPLAGLAGRIAPEIPMPVIDGTAAAVHLLRAIVQRPAAADVTRPE